MSAGDAAAQCAALCERYNAGPFYGRLGMRASSSGPGRAKVELPFSEALTQLYGDVHGGALLAVADACLNIAVATELLGDPEAAAGTRVGTVQVSMQFLEPVGRRDVVAEAEVIRRGRRLAFAECTLTAGDETVARAQGVCFVR